MAFMQNPYMGYQNPILAQQQVRLNQMEQQMYPYQQQQMYQQPVQQSVQQNVLNGRIVDDINTVNASEVLMDGSVSVFIKRDMSEVYLKRWNQNGTIDTSIYKIQTETKDKINDEHSNIENTLNEFQGMLITIDDKLGQVLKQSATPNKGGGRS